MKYFLTSLFILLGIFSGQLCAFTDETNPLRLTQDEVNYLNANPSLTVGHSLDFEPFLIEDNNGEYVGVIVDLYRKVAEKLGIQINFVTNSWEETIASLQQGEIDIIPFINKKLAEEKGLLTTDAGFNNFFRVYVRDDNPLQIDSLKDLYGRRIAYQSTIQVLDKFIAGYQQEMDLLPVNNALDGFVLVTDGKADAFIGFHSSAYLLLKQQILNIHPTYTLKELKVDTVAAVKPGDPTLQSILAKVLNSISYNEKREILEKWFGKERATAENFGGIESFSKSERAWLNEHPTARIYIGHYPPYYTNIPGEGVSGMVVDYLDYISKQSGITFEYVTGLKWSEALQKIKDKQIDILPAAYVTQERKDYLNFTDIYLKTPSVIFSREESAFIASINDLKGKTVLMEKGYATTKKLIAQYPEIKITIKNTTPDALKSLAEGEGDAYIGNLMVGTYISRFEGLTNLMVSAPSPFQSDEEAMAIRKDWPEATGIINKILASMPAEERELIRAKWLPPVEYQVGINTNTVITIVAAISSFSLGIIFIMLLWNKKLAQEVSARKEAERALKLTETNLRQAQELAKLGSWTLSKDGEVRFSDDMYQNLSISFDGSPPSLKEFFSVIHPEDRSSMKSWISQCSAGENPGEVQFRVVGSDNEIKSFSARGEPAVHQDGTVTIFGILQDITDKYNAELERKELQEQLHQKNKMEAVGHLAGGMAHNFNNNLAIILGNLELAQYLTKGSEQAQEFLTNAKTALMRSRDLIKQIMIYSRTSEETIHPVSAKDILEETSTLLTSTIPTSISFTQEISPESENALILGDFTRIQEALINLCTNSVHAMNEKGNLVIKLDRVQVNAHDLITLPAATQGDYLCFTVSDTGKGFSEETAEKIFDPFFTTKEVGEGTGMGLATVRGIVDSHNGFIRVNSAIGKGTVIKLYFPEGQKAEDSPAVEMDSESLRGSGKILIIDDDEMVLAVTQQTLEMLGYQVVAESNALQALDMVKQKTHGFDLIITDQTMPGLTGKELIEIIKKGQPDLPTILCTGYSSKISQDDAEQIGINAICMKPLEIGELAKAVKNCIK